VRDGSGGILWQLKGYKGFALWTRPSCDPPAPRQYEEMLIRGFVDQTGKLSFAHRQGQLVLGMPAVHPLGGLVTRGYIDRRFADTFWLSCM
jgi:hypothetical protein